MTHLNPRPQTLNPKNQTLLSIILAIRQVYGLMQPYVTSSYTCHIIIHIILATRQVYGLMQRGAMTRATASTKAHILKRFLYDAFNIVAVLGH